MGFRPRIPLILNNQMDARKMKDLRQKEYVVIEIEWKKIKAK